MDPNDSAVLPRHDFPEFGKDPFSPEEAALIQQYLEEDIGLEELRFREGPAGLTVAYVASQYLVNEANRIFGDDGWSATVKSLVEDYSGTVGDTKYSVGCTAIMRVTLRSGKYHEDVGCGSAEHEVFFVAKSNAQKGACTDALKRVLSRFGRRLGNCLKDTEYIDRARKYNESRKTSRWPGN